MLAFYFWPWPKLSASNFQKHLVRLIKKILWLWEVYRSALKIWWPHFLVAPQYLWTFVFNHCHFLWSNLLSGFWSFKGSLSYQSGPIYPRLCLCNLNTTRRHKIKIPLTSAAGKIWKADFESRLKEKAQTFSLAILYCPHSLEGFSNMTFVLADKVSHTKQVISGITQWKHLGKQVRNKRVAGMCNNQLRQARSQHKSYFEGSSLIWQPGWS